MHFISINDRVEKIKDNEQEINVLVGEYKPFIASCVEKAAGRYVRYGEDDELSIGLIAFVEAIKSYDSAKGNFLTFASNVIKRRIIDYYRKERKHSNVISLNRYLNDEEDEADLSVKESLDDYSESEISCYRKLEIEQLKKELGEWGISFFELVGLSPKHDRTRRLYADIVRYLLSRNELIEVIRNKRYLPVAEIEKGLNIARKKIDRARKYIIAVIIILTGDYLYIRDYVEIMKYGN